MTLGEFREYTKNMRDDVNLVYHHSGGYIPINTFGIANDNTLVMVNNNYEENHIMGIVTAMAVFDKRNEKNEE